MPQLPGPLAATGKNEFMFFFVAITKTTCLHGSAPFAIGSARNKTNTYVLQYSRARPWRDDTVRESSRGRGSAKTVMARLASQGLLRPAPRHVSLGGLGKAHPCPSQKTSLSSLSSRGGVALFGNSKNKGAARHVYRKIIK